MTPDHDIVRSPSHDTVDTADLLAQLRGVCRHWAMLGSALLLGGVVGYGVSYGFTPTYLSTALFIPPQQQQGSSAAALASLGALSTLVGGASQKNSADQYVTMMESVTVSDAIIKRFQLMKVYDKEFLDDARKKLAKRVQISVGKKDGLIRIDAEDADPKRAADMANQYVEELRIMTSRLAVTEAQQRRVFFERMLDDTKNKLVQSQIALEASGYTAGALKAEPRSAADVYAKLRADLTAAQVKLQVLQGSLADTAPAVVEQATSVKAIGDQVARLEASQVSDKSTPDYIGKYRDFKYQETLFDLYAKQYELARIDESREGALIQVVDAGQPAEHKNFPRRSVAAAMGALLALAAVASWLWVRVGAARPALR